MSVLVLIVDDDPHFRLFAEKALLAQGYDVETRENAFGLINRVAGFDDQGRPIRRPDVVVMDHMMPGLEGADSVQLLAKHAVASKVPVLLVSAGERDRLEAAATRHPRCRVLPKTGRMGGVVDAVDSLLQAVVPVTRNAC